MSVTAKVADRIPSRQVLAVLNASHPLAWERVGGIPLTSRALYPLHDLGVKKVLLLVAVEPLPADLRRWQKGIEIEKILPGKRDPIAAILPRLGKGESILYIDAVHLIDPRILRSLMAGGETTLAYIDGADRKTGRIRAAFLKPEDARHWAENGENFVTARAGVLLPEDVDPFSPEIRGSRTPYFLEVDSKAKAREATWIVIRSQQKKVMDLPAQFLDPPFENGLTRLLCETRIPPNLVTLTGTAVALAITWLFWHGFFITGAFGTFLVEILDGVDGKLARTKLQFSRLGRREDIIDYFCENGWYLALAVGLGSLTHSRGPAMIGGVLIVSDTVDNILYTLAGHWYGKSIDLFGAFDRVFRRIAGRRNIYGILFIIGFSVGYPLQTFALTAIWAFLTASIHAFRLVQFGRGAGREVSRNVEGL